MPTIGHAAIGFAAARAQSHDHQVRVGDLLLYGALAVAPDLDLLASTLHHPAAIPLGHRGATHSLVAALAIAAVLAPVAARASRLRTAFVVFVVVASHGLIDPLNRDSIGTAYFWPFSSVRLTWGHFHPIPITPVGLDALHGAGLQNLCVETLMFSPFLAYAFWPALRCVQRVGRRFAGMLIDELGRSSARDLVQPCTPEQLVVIVRPGREPQKAAMVMRWLRSLVPTAVLLVAPVSPGVVLDDAVVIMVDADDVDSGPLSVADALTRRPSAS